MSDYTSIASLVDSISIDDVEQYAAMFMYQGFSPEMVFQHLHNIKTTKNISTADFKNDIKVLVLMGAIMGNYNTNNSGKISTEGKDRGDSLMLKYDLKMGGLEGNKKAVNLPRIMSAFPILSSKMTIRCHPREYNGVFSSQLLPDFFKSPVSPSLIPKSMSQEIKTGLMALCNAYLAEQTMAIKGMTSGKDAYNLQWKFTQISHKSPVPSDEERREYMKGISFKYDTMSQIITILNSALGGQTSSALVMPSRQALTKAGLQVS